MQSHRLNRLVATGAAGLAGLVLVAALPAASASAATNSVNVTRKCAGTSVANLQVQREDTGQLSVDFGVDMAKHTAGVPWKVKETRNGKMFVSTPVKTISDGSFASLGALKPVAGTNAFVVYAVNTRTGQTCSITGSLLDRPALTRLGPGDLGNSKRLGVVHFAGGGSVRSPATSNTRR